MALTKRKFLPVMKYCTYNYFVFGKKKDAFSSVDFSSLKCQLKWKKIDTACL